MKTALLTLALAAGSAMSSFGQGAVVFKSFGSGSNGSIGTQFAFDEDGTTKLTGAGFSAELFYGAAGSSADALTGLASSISPFLTGALAGLFGSPTLTIPGVGIGETASLQVRIWNNAGGTITSYDSALSRASSSVLQITLTDPANLTPGATPTLVGLTSLTLAPVPEPATLALAGIGGLGLLAMRRKQA